MSLACLSLGSNLGDRLNHLTEALRLLAQRLTLLKLSSIYETEPVGYREQPFFLNCVCEVSTHLSPRELLALAKHIEAELARQPGFRNAPRTIDIDILTYGHQTMDTPDLVLPHPRLAERAFVLVPLAEIAPHLILPGSKETITGLAAKVNSQGVRVFAQVDITQVLPDSGLSEEGSEQSSGVSKNAGGGGWRES